MPHLEVPISHAGANLWLLFLQLRQELLVDPLRLFLVVRDEDVVVVVSNILVVPFFLPSASPYRNR